MASCPCKGTIQRLTIDQRSSFHSTDCREVTHLLGCELVRDRAARKATLQESVNAAHVLKVHGTWQHHPVKTPLEPGRSSSPRTTPLKLSPRSYTRATWPLGGMFATSGDHVPRLGVCVG